MHGDFPPGFNSNELRAFVDSLRDFLGLERLYCEKEPKEPLPLPLPDIFVEGWIIVQGGRQRTKLRPSHRHTV